MVSSAFGFQSSTPLACSGFSAWALVGQSGLVTAVVASRCFGRSLVTGQVLIELCSFVLRPFALPGFRRASSLLWPLLTSPGLSAGGSPRVSVCSFRSRRWVLQDVVSDYWASRLLAHSPPTSCLSAHSCSYGRTFAFHPFAPAPCGDDLVVRLQLASQAPVGNLSSRQTRHLPGTLAKGNALGIHARDTLALKGHPKAPGRFRRCGHQEKSPRGQRRPQGQR